jgi:DNA-binding NtrC family response regulator
MRADHPARGNRSVVAIINTSQETIELLQEILTDEGFAVVTAYVVEFKQGSLDLRAFFQTHQPAAVVYDIALPYVENWAFFREQVLAPRFLPEQHFVITTTNKSVLEVLVGPTHTIELVGRPFDLDAIVEAIRQAVYNRGERSQATTTE